MNSCMKRQYLQVTSIYSLFSQSDVICLVMISFGAGAAPGFRADIMECVRDHLQLKCVINVQYLTKYVVPKIKGG